MLPPPTAAALVAALLVARPALASQVPGGEPAAVARRLLAATEADRARLLAATAVTPELAAALLEAGDNARLASDFRGAVRAFRTAGEVARGAGARREAARALNGAAEALYRLGDLEPARRTAEEALRAHEVLGDAAGQAEAWNTIANVHHARADYEPSLASAQKALDLFRRAGDRRGVARILNNIASVHRARADIDAALALHQEALGTFEEIGDRRSAAVVLNGIAIDYFHRGEFPQALQHALRGLAEVEALGDWYRMAAALDVVGTLHHSLGAYARALDSYQRALAIRQDVGDKFGTLETVNNIGLVHFSHGDYHLAIEAYKRGLRLNAKMGGTTLVAEALYNIGAAAWRLGERRRAAANYRDSLRHARAKGADLLAASSQHDLGRMALEDGRLAEAQSLLERALATREAVRDQAGTAQALASLASLELAAGRPAGALARAERAHEIARRYEQPEAQWEALTLSGSAHRALGRPDLARGALEKAVEVIEGLRLQLVGREQGRTRFFESRLSPYHELMALAMERGARADALGWAERSRARVLADLAQGGRVDLTGAMTGEEKREEGRLRSALAAANRRLQTELGREEPDAAALARLEHDRRQRRSAYEAFQAALYARHPALQTHRGASPVFTLAEAERLLPDASTAVLEYAVTEEDAWLFTLTRDDGAVRLEAHALGAGRAALAALARRYRERLAARDVAFAQDARRAYERLLAPAAARLAGRTRIVIVPDGPLWDVPFQALQDGSGRYLIDTAAVSYAPSLTVLRAILDRRRPRSGARTVLAMGKAEFGGAGPAPATSLMAGLGPLPDAERQVRLIGELYGPGRSATYLGAEAREDRFKAEAPRHAILHLATHGVLDEASPLYSHVVLSPGARGSSEDGLLEAWEMAGLRLDADLVVLAACETGRGRVAPGEGIVGTTWALFVAGSQSLVVSQWKVEATSTTGLMAAFHRGLARGDGPTADHLRAASLELRRDPRFAHPFYWAAFVLVGNPY